MKSSDKSKPSSAGRTRGPKKPAYLDNFLMIAFDAIVAFDSQSRITFWNPAAEQLYGWTAQEAIGQLPTELFWPVPTSEAHELVTAGNARLKGGETIQGEYNALCKDGASLWVEYSARAIFDAHGQISGYVSVYRDITQRRRAEESLRISEDRLRLAVAAGNIGIWDIDLVRRERTWSKEGKAIYGLGPDEYLDFERQLALTHPDDRALVEGMVTAFRDLGALKQLNLEHRIIRPDGSLCWVEVHGEAIYEDGSLPVRLIGTIVDITERKRTEEALRESDERFRTLANAMPSIVWTAAPDGTITYANDQWWRYVGIRPEENETQWPELVLHPDDYERCVDAWTHARQNVPDEYLIEVRNRRYDGEYRWFQTRAVPARNASGKVTAWYGVTTDIHERIETEHRLALLAEISELVRTFEDPNELMFAVSKAVGDHLQARRCLFNEIDLENDIEIVHRDYCRDVGSVAGVHRITDYSSVTTAEMTAGKTVVNHDSKTDPRTAPDYERSYVENGERAYVAVPLMRENRWVASLWLSDDRPRQWSQEDVSLLETIAERTWIAVEKLRITEELQASETLYRTIARSIPGGGVYVVDKDMRYLVAEGQVTEAFGLSREILEGHTVSEVFHDAQRARMIERLTRNFAGETISYETEHEGRFYWTQQAPIGEPVDQAIILTLDITERKQVENALRQSEERFVRFMQYLPALAWIKDVKGHYVYANAAAEKAFNMPRDRLYGKTDQEIFPPEVAAQFRKNDERALIEEKGVQVVETLEQEDGVLHYSLVNKFPIPGPDGHTAMIGGTAFDITDRKKAEEALREHEKQMRLLNETLEQKVKERTAEVRKLASDLTKAEQRERHRISHILHDDLQQRVYAIQMQLTLLYDGLQMENDAARKEIADIKEQLDEILEVTRHLSIDLSPPILRDEGLAHAVGWLASQMREQYGLSIKVQADGPFAIPDEELQVLLFSFVRELLFNIVKHAGAKEARVALQWTKSGLRIEVSDDGRGFPVNEPEKSMAQKPGENEVLRTSFGLPTIRHRLSLFGGQLDIKSENGAGTQIVLTIPIYKDGLKIGEPAAN